MLRNYTVKEIFRGNGWASYTLNQLQLVLRNPHSLGARFFWQHLEPGGPWSEDRGPFDAGRHLHSDWDGEVARPMSGAEEARLVERLHELGFEAVTQQWLWEVLSPTLPHDGYGRVRR